MSDNDDRPTKLLLTREEAAIVFGVSRRFFGRILPKLKKMGLKEIRIGGARRFSISNLEEVERKLVKEGELLNTK